MTFTPKPTINFDERYIEAGETAKWDLTKGDLIRTALNMLQQHCHAASYNRGWWHDPISGLSLIPGDNAKDGAPRTREWEAAKVAFFPYVIATKVALCHGETSEGLEAYRVGATDDKIPYPGIVAEGADALIRWFDLIECLRQYHATLEALDAGEMAQVAYDDMAKQYSLAEAIMVKLPFNAGRVDHDFGKRNWLTNPNAKRF